MMGGRARVGQLTCPKAEAGKTKGARHGKASIRFATQEMCVVFVYSPFSLWFCELLRCLSTTQKKIKSKIVEKKAD